MTSALIRPTATVVVMMTTTVVVVFVVGDDTARVMATMAKFVVEEVDACG